MCFPVQPRDGGIQKRITECRMGALLRKEVLAYRSMLSIYGKTDPMSLPDKLPPAFESYYKLSRRLTDPVEDFLSSGNMSNSMQAVHHHGGLPRLLLQVPHRE